MVYVVEVRDRCRLMQRKRWWQNTVEVRFLIYLSAAQVQQMNVMGIVQIVLKDTVCDESEDNKVVFRSTWLRMKESEK